MKLRIDITLKKGVLDPQGEAVRHALGAMGFAGIGSVRQGKVIELDIDAASADEARAQADEMCRRLLANTVIEDYRIEVAA